VTVLSLEVSLISGFLILAPSPTITWVDEGLCIRYHILKLVPGVTVTEVLGEEASAADTPISTMFGVPAAKESGVELIILIRKINVTHMAVFFSLSFI